MLPVGPLPPNPAEFVGSHALAALLAELEQRADLVLIDTPPILDLSDAMTLSARVDGLVVVTRLPVAKRAMLAELHRVLATAPTMKLGVVLTGTTTGDTYGYGYGYGVAEEPRNPGDEGVSTTREAPPSGKAVRGAREKRPIDNHGDVAFLKHAPQRGRRGWLMRRLLLVADVVALSVSFGIVELTFGSAHTPTDALGFHTEFALFFLSLPIWIVLAKLYSLYDRDEERADYSTGDELIGVFHLVTVGTFLFFAGAWLTGLVHPTLQRSSPSGRWRSSR